MIGGVRVERERGVLGESKREREECEWEEKKGEECECGERGRNIELRERESVSEVRYFFYEQTSSN